MQTFKEFLVEHWITTDNTEEKMKYHDKLHDMIKNSYVHIGGYCGLKSGSEEEHNAISNDIKNPNHIIKMKKVAGNPVAVAIYKKQHGRKLIEGATDGSDLGKHHLKSLIKDDNTHKRAWAEVSGAIEHLNKKAGTPEIHSADAEHLTGKKVLKHNLDNSYTRLIGHEPKTKRLMGHTGNNWESK